MPEGSQPVASSEDQKAAAHQTNKRVQTSPTTYSHEITPPIQLGRHRMKSPHRFQTGRPWRRKSNRLPRSHGKGRLKCLARRTST